MQRSATHYAPCSFDEETHQNSIITPLNGAFRTDTRSPCGTGRQFPTAKRSRQNSTFLYSRKKPSRSNFERGPRYPTFSSLAPCLMRHSLLLLLGFPVVAAAFTFSSSRQRSTAQHQGRLPERLSESGAKRSVNAIRRDPNRFANPNAASELRPFQIYLLLECLMPPSQNST